MRSHEEGRKISRGIMLVSCFGTIVIAEAHRHPTVSPGAKVLLYVLGVMAIVAYIMSHSGHPDGLHSRRRKCFKEGMYLGLVFLAQFIAITLVAEFDFTYIKSNFSLMFFIVGAVGFCIGTACAYFLSDPKRRQ